jgi:hypothetical protein
VAILHLHGRPELLALSKETKRVALSIFDRQHSHRLLEIAETLLALSDHEVAGGQADRSSLARGR